MGQRNDLALTANILIEFAANGKQQVTSFISSVALGVVSLDVRAKLSHSRSNRS